MGVVVLLLPIHRSSYDTDMDVWDQDAVTAARQLIGYHFYVKQTDGQLTGGKIVETEAYTADDAASHSFHGETARNRVMFGEAGRLYVYFTYGMHWCVNIVTGPIGSAEAVLIRAITPDRGVAYIREHRRNRPDAELTNGPAKLCQALGITGADNGARIDGSRFAVVPPQDTPPSVEATMRIGIRHDQYRLWRFVATAS
jgi:DNA-3-methyladenine glycosylase